MEEPTTNTSKTHHEPGRRYKAGRLSGGVRPVVDIRPATRQTQATNHPSHVKTTPTERTTSTARPALPRTKRSMVLRRQMVTRAEEQKVKVKKARKKHFFATALTVLIVTTFGVVGWAFGDVLPFDLRLGSQQEKPAPKSVIVQSENATLAEKPVTPAEIAANQVSNNVPKSISIPKLDIYTRIRHVGVTLSGEPVAPSNIYDVGWFQQSGFPGDPGAVLLNGHQAGPTKKGVFATLDQLTIGDSVLLELGNGSILTYKVQRIQSYASGQIDMAAATNSIDPSKQGLNLVTTVTKYTGTEQRVLVFAIL